MKHPKAEYRRWIDILQETGRDLTKWEEDFIEDMRQRLDEGWNLTDNQAACLEKIYANKTPN